MGIKSAQPVSLLYTSLPSLGPFSLVFKGSWNSAHTVEPAWWTCLKMDSCTSGIQSFLRIASRMDINPKCSGGENLKPQQSLETLRLSLQYKNRDPRRWESVFLLAAEQGVSLGTNTTILRRCWVTDENVWGWAERHNLTWCACGGVSSWDCAHDFPLFFSFSLGFNICDLYTVREQRHL